MKKLVIILLGFLGGVSIWVNAGSNEGVTSAETHEEKALQLQIEIEEQKVAHLRGNLSPDERRLAIARWTKRNESRILEVKEEKKRRQKQKWAEVLLKPLPDQIPLLEGSDPDDFLAAARDYFEAVSDRIRAQEVAGELDQDFRTKHLEVMQASAHRRLLGDMRKARKIQREAEERDNVWPAPKTAGELALLDPLSRIEAEKYAKIHEVISPPLAEGEDVRHRWARIRGFLKAKDQEAKALRPSKENRLQNEINLLKEKKNAIKTK